MQIGGSLGQGLLLPTPINEGRKAHPWDPEPSAARLGPRSFSTGVVVSLEEGFVWINLLLSTSEKGSMVPTIS